MFEVCLSHLPVCLYICCYVLQENRNIYQLAVALNYISNFFNINVELFGNLLKPQPANQSPDLAYVCCSIPTAFQKRLLHLRPGLSVK